MPTDVYEKGAAEITDDDRRQLQEESRKAAEERLADRSRRVTIDRGDPTVGWTVQQGPEPASLTDYPQVYTPEQLPDPTVALLSGVPPQAIPPTAILEQDDAFDHPRGPEPGEAERASKRAAVRQRIADDLDSDADALQMTTLGLSDVIRQHALRGEPGSSAADYYLGSEEKRAQQREARAETRGRRVVQRPSDVEPDPGAGDGDKTGNGEPGGSSTEPTE